MLPASSPAHTRVTLKGFPIEMPGTWARKSGGNVTSEARRWREGGELTKEEVAGGPSTTEDVTVSRNYRPDRDGEILRWAKRHGGRAYGTLIEQDLDSDENPYGKPVVSRVLLLGVNGKDVDADDTSGFQMLELTLAITGESS